MSRLTIFEVNRGHCQITYKLKVPGEAPFYYCLQDNKPVRLMRCTTEGEPQHEVSGFKTPTEIEFPVGNSELENKCREFINNHSSLVGTK